MKRTACALALLAVCAQGLAAQDIEARLRACALIGGDRERLECYDQLTARPAAAPVVAPAEPQPAAPSTVAEAEAEFGAESIRKSVHDDSAPQRIQSRVIGKLDGWKKGDLFRLENGQVWKCIDDRGNDLRLENPAVTIHRNFIGSYFMRFDGMNAQPRVRRVK